MPHDKLLRNRNRVKLLESIVPAYRFVNDMPEKHHQNLYFLQLQNLSSGYIFSGNIAVIGKVDQSFESVLRRELQWSWNSAVIKHNRIKFIPLLKASNLSKEGTASSVPI